MAFTADEGDVVIRSWWATGGQVRHWDQTPKIFQMNQMVKDWKSNYRRELYFKIRFLFLRRNLSNLKKGKENKSKENDEFCTIKLSLCSSKNAKENQNNRLGDK